MFENEWNDLPSEVEPYERSNTYCDSCGVTNEPTYWSSQKVDFCTSCVTDESETLRNVFAKNKNVERIDRLDYSTVEKPVRWPCALCPKKMGGGHEWWLIKSGGKVTFDICVDCIDKSVGNFLVLVSPDNGFFMVERVYPPAIVDLRDVDGEITPLEKYANQVGDIKSMRSWISYLSDLCEYDLKMGSLKNWIPFGDEYEWPFQGIITGFLMDCSEGEGRGRVASYLYDNHGRLGINLAYGSIAEFEAARQEFEKITPATEEKVKLYQDSFSVTEPELYSSFAMDQAKGFSGYVRVNKGFSNYYG